MQEAFDIAKMTEALQAALAQAMPGAEVAVDPADDMTALSFVHPAHEATAIVVLDAAPGDPSGPAMLLAVVLGDWADVEREPLGVRNLLMLNTRLMTSAIGVLPLNEDELALVLSRRMPIDALALEEVLPAIEDMIWEYARCSGWLQGQGAPQPGQAAQERPGVGRPSPLDPSQGRPRLIGSLDEV